MRLKQLLGTGAAMLLIASIAGSQLISPVAAQAPAPAPAPASPAQPEAIEPEGQKLRVRTAEARDACRTDVAKLCGQTTDAAVGRSECLKTNLTKLTPTCRAAFDRQQELQARMRLACRGDLQTLCKDATVSGRAKLLCLQQQVKQVSPACASTLATLAAAGEQGAKKKGGAAPKL